MQFIVCLSVQNRPNIKGRSTESVSNQRSQLHKTHHSEDSICFAMLLQTRPILLCLFLTAYVDAITHLHKGPQAVGETFVLHGFTHGSAPDFSSRYDSKLYTQFDHTVRFSVDLKSNVILWEELEDDNIALSSCVRHANNHDVMIDLVGKNLDTADYGQGTAFVIDLGHWERLCGSVPSLRGINRKDPVLFFKINNITVMHAFPKIRLGMNAISGSDVAPSVRFDVIEQPLKHHTQKRYVFHDSPAFEAISRMLGAPIGSLPSGGSSDSTSGSGIVSEFAVFPGANISVSGHVEGTIKNVRITRLFDLELGWEQSLKADLSSRFVASRRYRASNEREVSRKPIRKASSSGRIAFFGRYQFNAFTVVDVVQQVEADAGVDAFLRASHENLQAVTASFASNEVDTESLLPPDTGSYGSLNINFDKVIHHHVGISGFYGTRPGIVAEASFAGFSLVGKYTATLGLEASMQKRFPPFTPLRSHGKTLGNCKKCHGLQGRASVKGKDLQYFVHENGVLKKHKVLDHSLFEKELTTVCAFTQVCLA